MAYEWHDGLHLQFFSPDEFDHPELMDPTFLQDLDRVRMRCGFPLTINDDARTQAELEAIYAKEIAKGLPWAKDSSHLYIAAVKALPLPDDPDDEKVIPPILVRACDLEPSIPKPNDGCDLTLEKRELRLTAELLRMYEQNRWPYFGLGLETGHWHVDDTPRLAHKRPAYWVAVSK